MLGVVARRVVDVVGRPIDRVVGGRGSAAFVALIYHRVGGRSPSPVDLPLAAFDEQLDLLAESSRVIGLGEALAALDVPASSSPGDDNRPAVVLTFDDGTADWVDLVAPRLVDRGLPATFYVATDFVERQRPFPDDGHPISWGGLAELASIEHVTIGSHTHTHRVLASADAATTIAEVDRSIDLLGDRLAMGGDHFAYPKAVAGSPAAETVIRRRFASAVLAGNRGNSPRSDRHRLGRHGLTVADTIDRFQRKVHGRVVLEGWLRERRDAWQA